MGAFLQTFFIDFGTSKNIASIEKFLGCKPYQAYESFFFFKLSMDLLTSPYQ